MWEEWLNYFYATERTPKTPADDLQYLISRTVITQTENVLKEYSNVDDGHEGLVYWAGYRDGNRIYVNAVIAPETISSEGRVTIPPLSNYYVVQCLSDTKLVQLAQVHSHPGSWVGHSAGDDRRAAFKRTGLLSLVVGNYCHNGMLPLKNCGIHRYDGNDFIRLSKNYISKHFQITSEHGKLFDLRDKTDERWMQKNGID